MINHYEILGVKPSDSKNRIFRSFCKRLKVVTKQHVSGNDQTEKVVTLFQSYFILEGESFRKYYDLLLKHQSTSTGKTLRPDTLIKYTRVMAMALVKSKKPATFYLNEPNDLMKRFDSKTLIIIFGDLIMFPIIMLLGDFGSKTSFFILLSIAAVVLIIYSMLNKLPLAAGLGISILTSGIYFCRESITTLRREKFNVVLGMEYNSTHDRYEF